MNAMPDMKGRNIMDNLWYYSLIDFRKVIDSKYLDGIKPLFYKRSGLIYSQGDKSDRIYVVLEGIVKIFNLTVAGREACMSLRYPGTIFGIAEIYGSDFRFYFAEAYEDATVLPIGKGLLTTIINEKPSIALKIIEACGKRIIEKEMYIEDSVMRNAEVRVAHFLVKIAMHQGVCLEDGSAKINSKLSHQIVADLVGLSRQTVTTVLTNLRKNGFIKLSHREILIKDVRMLMHHARDRTISEVKG